jgi:Baseplate J-like protein
MADYQYVEETGVILPDTADLQAVVEDEYRAVFGADLVVTPNTPQGVLITAETIARANALANNAAVANQINPNLAGGAFLDAIWSLTGGQRIAATKSTIAGVALAGVAGTLIPAGTIAAKADGTQFASVGDVTLDGTGAAVVDFVALDFGPVACNPGALNTVVSGVLGWETVTNANAAVLGRLVESDGASRIRRRQTLALQGSGGPEAIISGLMDTEGVRSLSFRENVTDAPAVIDGINMAAHSIYVCVEGGTDLAVATTLLERKSMGAGYNGAVTVNVTEPLSGQVYPVTFDRPTLVPVIARATVKVMGATGDPQELVRAAIVAFAAGELEGEAGFVVGTDVSPFELAGAVNVQTPGLYVQNMEVSLQSVVNYQPTTIPIALDELATIAPGSITVVIV